MVSFTLPIWVVHESAADPPMANTAKSECFLAFSAIERIGQYLTRHGMGCVRVDRIDNDHALMFLVNDLQRAGQMSMRLDVDADGRGGDLLLADSMLARIRQRH